MKEIASPPSLIPEQLSGTNQEWLNKQLEAERQHERAVVARQAIKFSQDPRNIRAR